jgi:hypothetical protein
MPDITDDELLAIGSGAPPRLPKSKKPPAAGLGLPMAQPVRIPANIPVLPPVGNAPRPGQNSATVAAIDGLLNEPVQPAASASASTTPRPLVDISDGELLAIGKPKPAAPARSLPFRNPDTHAAFTGLQDDAAKLGLEVRVISGDRDYALQKKWWDRAKPIPGRPNVRMQANGLPIAMPGKSEHQEGSAGDIEVRKNGRKLKYSEFGPIIPLAQARGLHQLKGDPVHFSFRPSAGPRIRTAAELTASTRTPAPASRTRAPLVDISDDELLAIGKQTGNKPATVAMAAGNLYDPPKPQMGPPRPGTERPGKLSADAVFGPNTYDPIHQRERRPATPLENIGNNLQRATLAIPENQAILREYQGLQVQDPVKFPRFQRLSDNPATARKQAAELRDLQRFAEFGQGDPAKFTPWQKANLKAMQALVRYTHLPENDRRLYKAGAIDAGLAAGGEVLGLAGQAITKLPRVAAMISRAGKAAPAVQHGITGAVVGAPLGAAQGVATENLQNPNATPGDYFRAGGQGALMGGAGGLGLGLAAGGATALLRRLSTSRAAAAEAATNSARAQVRQNIQQQRAGGIAPPRPDAIRTQVPPRPANRLPVDRAPATGRFTKAGEGLPAHRTPTLDTPEGPVPIRKGLPVEVPDLSKGTRFIVERIEGETIHLRAPNGTTAKVLPRVLRPAAPVTQAEAVGGMRLAPEPTATPAPRLEAPTVPVVAREGHAYAIPPRDPLAVNLTVEGTQQTARLTPEQLPRWREMDAAEQAAAQRVRDARAKWSAAAPDSTEKIRLRADLDQANSAARGLAMANAAERRQMTGLLTGKERQAAEAEAARLLPGRPVQSPAGKGEVVSRPVYGRLKVKLEDGREVTVPARETQVIRPGAEPVAATPEGSAQPEANAKRAARIESLKANVAKLEVETGQSSATPSAGIAGGENRSASLSRQHNRNTARYLEAGRQLGEAKAELARLERLQEGVASGRLHPNGQPRKAAAPTPEPPKAPRASKAEATTISADGRIQLKGRAAALSAEETDDLIQGLGIRENRPGSERWLMDTPQPRSSAAFKRLEDPDTLAAVRKLRDQRESPAPTPVEKTVLPPKATPGKPAQKLTSPAEAPISANIAKPAAPPPVEPPAAPVVPAPPEPPQRPKYAGSINLERIDAPDDVLDNILRQARDNEPAITKQRRGTITHAETEQAAKDLGLTVEQVQKIRPGSALNAEELVALRGVHLHLREEAMAAAKSLTADDSTANLIRFEKASRELEAVHLALQGASSEAGRALSAHRIAAKALKPAVTVADVLDPAKAPRMVTPEPPRRQAVARPVTEPPAPKGRPATTRKPAPAKPTFGAENRVFTADKAAAARERILAKAGRLGSGVPVEMLPDLLELGGFYVEGGLRTFARWSAQMAKDAPFLTEAQQRTIWDKIKPETVKRVREQAQRDKALQTVLESLGGRDELLEKARTLAAVDTGDPFAVAKWVQNQQKLTPWQMFSSYRKASLLSGPKSFQRNVVSTALFTQFRTPTNALASLYDIPLAAVEKRARVGSVKGAGVGMAAAIREGAPAGRTAFLETARHGLTAEEARRLELPMRELPGGAKNPLNLITRMMSASDQYFKAVVRIGEATELAYNQAVKEGLKGEALNARILELREDDAILEAAEKAAKYYTYNSDPNALARRFIDWKRVRPNASLGEKALAGAVDWFIPFTKVPLNDLAAKLEYSPVGLARLFEPNVRNTPGEVSQVLAKATIGTAIWAMMYNLIQDDNITGKTPGEAGAREAFYGSGRKPYAIKMAYPGGHFWVSLQSTPFASIVGTVAGVKEHFWDKGERTPREKFVQVASDFMKAFGDQSFVSGLTALSDFYNNPERSAERFTAQQAGSVIPLSAFVRAMADVSDPIMRQAPRKGLEGIGDQLKTGIPGLNRTLQPRVDAMGREVKKDPAGLGALQPFVVGRENTDPARKELARLQVFPTPPRNGGQVGSEKLDLAPEQLTGLQKAVGQAALLATLREMARPGYKALSADMQQERMEDALRKAKKAARIKYLRSIGVQVKRRRSGS